MSVTYTDTHTLRATDNQAERNPYAPPFAATENDIKVGIQLLIVNTEKSNPYIETITVDRIAGNTISEEQRKLQRFMHLMGVARKAPSNTRPSTDHYGVAFHQAWSTNTFALVNTPENRRLLATYMLAENSPEARVILRLLIELYLH